ncbi:hypothetical protein A2483_00310 [Candidatus Peregrinibacteria bacterium RIFOXYC2_FULL_33_13]|nr:MAG: hypothetical protein UR27_C0019G0016 [Candidatus Peregrinibacteria bacterium GW2011_GWA2_33_10]KKP39935.1 MAG: hypothetical protein UR30_C0007G0036 [Candidatus Peregrinibacteria bacterium GW2011_GWC2_33_13]OGJ48167.1 MAG: hypothetical protein A2229_03960 [Candidatus Peregrinibacteria bacterium RIFOXYA2_FULL_33_7]OGJ53526.1 MAG: hypothetical protein A2483_00310 [Candidatus Peregrinibacteria bacterium RIFOXYC2_FULL_33_13]
MRSLNLNEKDSRFPINPDSVIGKIIIGSLIITGGIIYGIRDKIFTKTIPEIKEGENQHNEFHLATKYENQIPKDSPKYQEDDDSLNEEGNLPPELEKLKDKAKIFFDKIKENKKTAKQAEQSIREQLDKELGTDNQLLEDSQKEQRLLKSIRDSFFQINHENLDKLHALAFNISKQSIISDENITNLLNEFNLSQLFELYDIYKLQNSTQGNEQMINFVIDNARETIYNENYDHGNIYLE